MIPQLHTCIILSNENHLHITRGLPQDESDPVKRVIEEDEAEDEKRRKKANYRLNMLQLNPKQLSGVALFEHQVAFRQR